MKYLKGLIEPPSALSSTSTSSLSSYTPYILSLISSLLYPFTWLYCNEQKISIAENSILRGLACCAIHYTTCSLTSSPTDLPCTNSLKLTIFRSMIIAFYFSIISLAQYILPLPAVHTINSSGPIFVFVVDYFVNGVKINSKQAVGVGVGLVGVILAGNGRVIMELMDGQFTEVTEFKHYVTNDIRIIAGFTVIFIFTMFCWAYAVVMTKQISANTFQINFIMGLVIQFIGTLIYPFTNNNSNYPTLLLATILTGIPVTVCQTLNIAAYRMTKNTGVVSLMAFSGVAVSYGISIFRYSQKPNIVTSLGVGLVLFGLWTAIFAKSKV